MKKHDFIMVITAENCNPNGDPLNEGRPRTNINGFGEISAECIKRKIRNRLLDMGKEIFVQSDCHCKDEYKSLYERAMGNKDIEKAFKENNEKNVAEIACDKWMDVRLFGQLFAFTGGISVGIRGAVSICHATTVTPVSVKDVQITKSVNSEPSKKGKGKSSDTMGCKYIVEKGVYVVKGSVNPFYCEKNHVSDEDISALKSAMCTLFENDESSARPSGSMEVTQIYWFEQDGSDYVPSAKLHKLVSIDDNGNGCVENEIPDSVHYEELI